MTFLCENLRGRKKKKKVKKISTFFYVKNYFYKNYKFQKLPKRFRIIPRKNILALKEPKACKAQPV